MTTDARPARRACHNPAVTTNADTVHRITTEAEIRALIGGEPTEVVQSKLADHLNGLTRQFIERSPFVLVGTAHPDGGLDVSPKGDPAGFVQILDEQTLLLPDRPGNRLADTLTNLLVDDRIALLFLIPGVGDIFRVNGRAVITDDRELLEPCAIRGSVPKLGILITVEQAYTHCPKAIMRSDLWNPDRHIDRSELPSSGEVLRSLNGPSFDGDGYDRERTARYARGEGLY
jgi:PPOX class probable FMN-dependent enzyme